MIDHPDSETFCDAFDGLEADEDLAGEIWDSSSLVEIQKMRIDVDSGIFQVDYSKPSLSSI